MMVLEVMAKETKVKIVLGESSAKKLESGHILVTVPGYLFNRVLKARKITLDLSALKMIVIDEADEILTQRDIGYEFLGLNKYMKKIDVNPQFCLYSATFPPDVMKVAQQVVGTLKCFIIKKESLKL